MRCLVFFSVLLSGLCQGLEYQTLDTQFFERSQLKSLNHNSYAGLADQDGYSWFGNSDGLFRFDGQELIKVSPQLTSNLPAFAANSLLRSGRNLWIGSSIGLLKLDLDSYRFQTYSKPEHPNSIQHLSLDQHGGFWVSGNDGVFLYQPQNDGFIHFPLSPQTQDLALSQAANTVRRVAMDDNGMVWLAGHQQGLLLLDPATGHYLPGHKAIQGELSDNLIAQLSGPWVSDVIYTKHNTIMVAVENKLVEINSDNRIVQNYPLSQHPSQGKQQAENETATPSTHLMAEDGNANIWLTGADNTLYKLAGDRSVLAKHVHSASDINSIRPQQPVSVFIAQRNTLVLQYPDYPPQFYNTINQFSHQQNIAAKNNSRFVVRDIQQSKTGVSWLTGDSGWIESNGEIQNHYPAPAGASHSFLQLTLDQQQRPWLGSSTGAYQLSPDGKKYDQYIDAPVHDMAYQADIGVWVKTPKQLYLINSQDQSMAKFKLLDLADKNGLSSKLAVDPKWGLWLANAKVALHYNKNKHNFDVVDFPNSIFIPGRSEILINDNTLYMTGNGLIQADIKRRAGKLILSNVRKVAAFNGNTIANITIDAHGNLWLLDVNGEQISRHNIESGKTTDFNRGDGFPRQTITSNIFFGPQSQMLMASNDRLIGLTTPNLHLSQELTRIKITSVKVFNTDQGQRLHLGNNRTLELNHYDSGIDVHFSDGSGKTGAALAAQYRLRGSSDAWLNVRANNISLPKLSPGRYTLELRTPALPKDIQQLSIQVLAAPWRTSQAYALYVLLISGILGFIFYTKWQQYRQQRTADEQIRLYAQGFEHVADAFCVADKQGRILSHNGVFSELLGMHDDAIIDSLQQLRASKTSNKHYRKIWLQLHRSGSWQGQSWIKNSDGVTTPINCRASIVQQDAGKDALCMLVLRDISQNLVDEEKLLRLANHDNLTQLVSRHRLDEIIKQKLLRQQRQPGYNFGLLFIKLERFNTGQGSLSQRQRDLLLVAIADRLKRPLAPTDTLAKLEGGEFIALIDNHDDKLSINQYCRTIINESGRAVKVDNKNINTSLSIGIAMYPYNGKTPEQLISHADIAMRSLNNGGSNGFAYFEPYMNADLLAAVKLEAGIQESLKFRSFVPFYQAQVDMQTGKLIGAEALARWRKPNGEIICAADFVATAEQNGMISKIGLMILEKVCQQQALWHIKRAKPLPIAINLSVAELIQADFIEQLNCIVERYTFPRELIEFEVNEATLMSDLAGSVKKLGYLRSMGHKISIDNFGSGQFRLADLGKLPIDKLKIDRRFSNETLEYDEHNSVAKTIIELAHKLGIEVTGTGIEDQAGRDYWQYLGCTTGQGYYFDRPMPANHFEISELFKQQNTNFKPQRSNTVTLNFKTNHKHNAG